MAKKAKAGKPRGSASSKVARLVPKTPRDTALPGMEDSAIEAIEKAAIAYVEVRDERMALTQQETLLKDKLLKVMHAHKKDHYSRGNLDIRIVPEGETVKVRLKKEKGDKE